MNPALLLSITSQHYLNRNRIDRLDLCPYICFRKYEIDTSTGISTSVSAAKKCCFANERVLEAVYSLFSYYQSARPKPHCHSLEKWGKKKINNSECNENQGLFIPTAILDNRT